MMARKLWFISACIAIVFVVVFASAIRISAQTGQSFQYVIPHFSANEGSELVLSNLSGGTAHPEVTMSDSGAGQFADGFVTIGAGTQQRLTGASLGLSAFEGSVVVTSSVRLSVIATIAAGNAFETVRAIETALDPANPSSGATQLIVPFSQGTAGQMMLTIFNPNNAQTSVVLVPVGPDGLLMGQVQATIPPFGTVKEDISALFPQSGRVPRDMSYLLIRVPTSLFGSGRGVFAQAEMVNFSDRNEDIPAARADFSAVTAVPVGDAVSSGSIPFFTEGGDYVTELQFINATAASAAITLTANGVDGNPVPGTSPATITLPPNGSVRRNVQHIFNFNGAAVQGAISFNSTANVIATEGIAGVSGTSFALVPTGPKRDTDLVFSVHTYDPEYFTGLTLVNPDPSTAANLVLRYVSDDGTPVSSTALTLDPSAGMVEATRLLGDLMPEAQNAGFLHIHSDIPILAAALEGEVDNSVLAALPAMHPQADYQPPDPTTFLVSGNVRQVTSANQGGMGIPGVGVQLTGPIAGGAATPAVNISATTNQYGAFTLPQLQQPPVGDYMLSATATGYSLSAPITIHIAADANGNTSGNSRGNDFTATMQQPNICEMQPAGVLAGSSSTTLIVIGSPLAPNAQILFNGKALPTASTTATTVTSGCLATLGAGANQAVPALQATLDPTLLTQPGAAQIAVQTNGPAGNAQSQPHSLGIGSAAPVLTGLGALPSPLIAGCCPVGTTNPGLTTTITGTGFAPTTTTTSGTVGVNVLVGVATNGVITTIKTLQPDSGAVVFQSPTSIQVTLSPDLLAIGRVLKISVINPGPTIGPSNILDLPVLNPIPVVTQIQPNKSYVELEPNSPPLQLKVNGFGFQPGATINAGGVTIPLDPTQPQTSNSLVGFIPASALGIAGVFPVTVVNPSPSVGPSAAVPFYLENLEPLLSSVEPVPVTPDKPLTFDPTRPSETYPATIIARGSNFSSASIFQLINLCAPITITPTSATVSVLQRQQFTAYINGQPATSSQVTWKIASSTGSSAGPIGVIDQNGLYTAPVIVPNPAVVVVTVTSNSDPTLFAVAMVTIANQSQAPGTGAGALGATVVSPHEADLNVTISCAGQYVIYVENPQPGGGTSQKASFTVAAYTPSSQAQAVISSLTPPVTPVALSSTADLTLTITGANFEAGAIVNFGSTVLFPTSISPTAITVKVPWYLLTVHGSVPVLVTNPDTTGSSNRVLFGVN